jgi:hypothetical protein
MQRESATAPCLAGQRKCGLALLGIYSGLRVLAWCGNLLYASRGYTLLRAEVLSARAGALRWQQVGCFHPALWRQVSASLRWTARLFRDGFHALAVLASGSLVAAVPGAIVVLPKAEREFAVSHRITRGTRPLHIASTPDGRLFWGEYFDNPRRDEVHVYASSDGGASWEIAYTFASGEIRHVHNIVYDAWEGCLWILTGDYGAECRIVRASCDFKHVETMVSGSQHARAVAMVATKHALYFSSDTPLERNHIFRLHRTGSLTTVSDLNSSSIYGCGVDDKIFFSTMVEPSAVNSDERVRLYGGDNENGDWTPLLSWQKDSLPMRYFQYGNAILPDGVNTSGVLAVTTIAVRKGDFETTLWRVEGTKTGDS